MMPVSILGISITGKPVMQVTRGFGATVTENLTTFK